MENKDTLRRVKNLMYKHDMCWSKPTDRKIIFDLYEKHKDNQHKSKEFWSRVIELVNLYKLIDSLNLTEKEIHDMWWEISQEKHKQQNDYKNKPQKEGRDNKDVHVGSGNSSNNNTVRYPSKKRSIRTWKKFYNLFPYYAVLDGWDGKTSKRMK
jgi:hypothetical protein